MHATSWTELPETEGLPNNFRRAVAGREISVNRITWVHPTELPPHVHDDAEQALVMLEGRIRFSIDGTEMELAAGDVAIVPRHAVHGGRSIEGEAVFIEVFSPMRVDLLPGFLGGASMPTGEQP
ncbi:cupin domain-containing protein [Nocardioidaceae bacterium]|nr:cupin domain-containing protein [Nocardioidaceae bacterium]